MPSLADKTTTPDPTESAKAAGLGYMAGEGPGISRRRAGKGCRYLGVDGKRVRDEATLKRIRFLAIPPAWKDVWICPLANGHLQATGRDARGRKQYRYHPRYHYDLRQLLKAKLLQRARTWVLRTWRLTGSDKRR